MLSRNDIKKQIELAQSDPGKGISVTPSPLYGSEGQIGDASLDVRLGRWFMVVLQTKTSEIDLSQSQDATTFEAKESRSHYIPFGEKFILHPGRFVLASTLEWVRFPANIGGYILGKSTFGRRGLVVETAAGIHPGFSGCLTLELFNCGEVPIGIVPGMRVAQIFFHYVHGDGEPKGSTYSGRRKPTIGNYEPEAFVARARQM
ncbi:dCTP deaminase [Pseudorhodoplanes sp.]|uniref:dCTP deaminase n=1 Tax=Pseudorhodoplanes sp. TaxID=1934341 RepID=UPI003D0F3ABB